MDSKKVYVIVGHGTSLGQVKDDLVDEGYPFDFTFDTYENRPKMDEADEVWCFGQVQSHHSYRVAFEAGKDIWYM